jgi:hypothetical protein
MKNDTSFVPMTSRIKKKKRDLPILQREKARGYQQERRNPDSTARLSRSSLAIVPMLRG